MFLYEFLVVGLAHANYSLCFMRRNTVKLLTHGGDMLELLHELRLPFVNWVISNQVLDILK